MEKERINEPWRKGQRKRDSKENEEVKVNEKENIKRCMRKSEKEKYETFSDRGCRDNG